jgi:hypothetical protein
MTPDPCLFKYNRCLVIGFQVVAGTLARLMKSLKNPIVYDILCIS